MKQMFPIFNGKDLTYLDSAATTHKPASVIDAITKFYSEEYSTVHRGLYKEALNITNRLEEVRKKVGAFISCDTDEVVFTHSATESINLIAYSYGEKNIQEGDEVLVAISEHHSNYIPWRRLCEQKGATFKTFAVFSDGTLDLDSFKKNLTSKTKLVAVSHQSNVLGIVNPIKEITEMAHAVSAVVVVDGAQMIAHDHVDVKDLNADFYVFSGHKMYGPTGVGIMYGKKALLEAMDPFHGGGGMVESIDKDMMTYRSYPHKFEAGTPMIASILGLSAAIDFINEIGFAKIREHEKKLSIELYDALKDEVEFITPLCRGSSILTFTKEGSHPTDIAMLLSLDGIAIRAGNMCASPLLSSLGLDSVTRISLGVYNDSTDIETLVRSLSNLKQAR